MVTMVTMYMYDICQSWKAIVWLSVMAQVLVGVGLGLGWGWLSERCAVKLQSSQIMENLQKSWTVWGLGFELNCLGFGVWELNCLGGNLFQLKLGAVWNHCLSHNPHGNKSINFSSFNLHDRTAVRSGAGTQQVPWPVSGEVQKLAYRVLD